MYHLIPNDFYWSQVSTENIPVSIWRNRKVLFILSHGEQALASPTQHLPIYPKTKMPLYGSYLFSLGVGVIWPGQRHWLASDCLGFLPRATRKSVGDEELNSSYYLISVSTESLLWFKSFNQLTWIIIIALRMFASALYPSLLLSYQLL